MIIMTITTITTITERMPDAVEGYGVSIPSRELYREIRGQSDHTPGVVEAFIDTFVQEIHSPSMRSLRLSMDYHFPNRRMDMYYAVGRMEAEPNVELTLRAGTCKGNLGSTPILDLALKYWDNGGGNIYVVTPFYFEEAKRLVYEKQSVTITPVHYQSREEVVVDIEDWRLQSIADRIADKIKFKIK